MRPIHSIQGIGTLREITIWKAFVFGILTIGIYILVLTYQNSKDIQATREKPFDLWQLCFWVGIIFTPLMIVLWAFNGIGLNELRARTGQADSSTWIVALVLGILLPIVGQVVWSVHFNDSVRSAGRGAVAAPMTAGTPVASQQ